MQAVRLFTGFSKTGRSEKIDPEPVLIVVCAEFAYIACVIGFSTPELLI